jgi:hypothetical protein
MAPETEQPTAPAATALVANGAPTPTVRPNRIRRASGRHPKRHRETVVGDTNNAFANAFPDEEPTEYGRRRELEILAEVAREEREGRRDDEQRQLVETGLIVREGEQC